MYYMHLPMPMPGALIDSDAAKVEGEALLIGLSARAGGARCRGRLEAMAYALSADDRIATIIKPLEAVNPQP